MKDVIVFGTLIKIKEEEYSHLIFLETLSEEVKDNIELNKYKEELLEYYCRSPVKEGML